MISKLKDKKQITYSVYFLSGMIMILICFIREKHCMSLISMLVFLIYLLVYALNHVRIVVKYAFLFIAIAFSMLGVLCCDYGDVYLVELGVTSRYVGALCPLSVLYWITTMMLLWTDSYFSKRIHFHSRYKYNIGGVSLTDIVKQFAPAMVFILGGVFWMLVFKHPSFRLNVNRFSYVAYMPGWLYKMRTIPLLLAPWVYMSIMDNRSFRTARSKIGMILLTYSPYILFCFWIGNKYGMFTDMIMAFAIPAVSIFDGKKIDTKMVIKLGIGFIIMLMSVIFLFWYLRGFSIGQMGSKLATRLSQQGEIWWIEVSKGDWIGRHFNRAKDEISAVLTSIVTRGEIKEYGVYRLMRLYGNSAYLKSYYDIDMRLSAQGFELLFYYFGLLAFCIFPLVISIVYPIIVNLYSCAVRSRSFSAIVYLRLLILFVTALNQGDWYRFTSLLDIILILLLIVDIALRNRNISSLKTAELIE